MQLGRAGVDAGQLEEVDDHGVEAADLADDDVERLLRAVGKLAAPAVDDLGGGGQGGDGGAQLVAHVGGEAGLALDPGLDGVGHVVERVDEAVEVGVAFEGDSGAQVAGGDLARRIGDRPSGWTRRRLVQIPTPVARSTVIAEPMTSASRIELRVSAVESGSNAS